MSEYWYHPDMSQACAEQLLLHDGRDGAFLVRPSESVRGAFAICVLYKQQVHTYRVLPEENGMLSVQSVQGFEVKRFPGLSALVAGYKNKQNGMITSLQYPVRWDGGGSDAHIDEEDPTTHWDTLSFPHSTHQQEDRQDLEVKDLGLYSLTPTLEMECRMLDRQIEVTLCSLKILTQVFGHISSILHPEDDKVFSVDKLLYKVLAVQDTVGVIESKAVHVYQDFVSTFSASPISHPYDSPKLAMTSPNQKMALNDKSQPRISAPQKISVFLGTWNMGNSPPPRTISSWLSCTGSGRTMDDTNLCVAHDLYVIGTQENPQGDREWNDFLKEALLTHTGKQYALASAQSLGGVKLVLMVKQEYKNIISHVQTSNVRTRISDALGNRGAVGISFDFNGTPLGFVTCHLVSGSEKIQKRNQSCGDILRSLTLGDESLRCFQLPLRLKYLFWMGDLNYKINMPVQDVLQSVYRGQYNLLLPVDQLNQERERKKVFLGFKEEPVTFPPTCRYERGSRTYDLQKAKTTGTRIFAPSWSDRILWTSYPDTDVKCSSYGCTDDIVTSDHSPVFATFDIGLNSQVQKGLSCTLRFQSIEVIIKTHHRSRACIEFRSLCLRGSPQSTPNSVLCTEGSAFLKLGWTIVDLPELTLIGQDPNADPTGHLLLSIKPADGGESYGECSLSVRALCNSWDNHFEAFLSHRGEETGSLRGRLSEINISEVNLEKNLKSMHGEAEKINDNSSNNTCTTDFSFESLTAQPLKHLRRRRPASICVAGSYSNAEYFLFESIQSPHTPTSPRPRSAHVSGEHEVSTEHNARREFIQSHGAPRSKRPSSKY
ncbi:phosphatidylinositol 3,4,5-trisphosphate 5-phosphatase 2 [Pelobates cultripes]|uniref:phosphatidylinositol-3,4,5-trisphosphate 5-phosphatase n=1 Tax=Pelobates cultripes TaxID=61616 RepID=A0AAD1T5C0_PELCU|nr:phosphatidylinositol 3,4,5-trisphosphate 5-phosphatase 2 [Pelobates cultripes]